MIPEFSVVIPTYNRPQRLQLCLQSLLELDYPRDRFEVIVVDDGGVCPLEPVVAPFQGTLRLRLLQQPNAGPATARNTGAASAEGRFLAFTDDDCAPAPGWLTAMAAALERTPEALVGGRVVNALAGNRFATVSQQLVSYHYDWFNHDDSPTRFLCSNNWALAADGFTSTGGFNTIFRMASGEDIEFCDRWLHSGRPVIYCQHAAVMHAHALTLRGFWRQQFNYGRGAVQVQRLRGSRQQPGRRKGPAFYSGLLKMALGQGTVAERGTGLSLLVLSQVANTLGFHYEARRSPAPSLAHAVTSPGPVGGAAPEARDP